MIEGRVEKFKAAAVGCSDPVTGLIMMVLDDSGRVRAHCYGQPDHVVSALANQIKQLAEQEHPMLKLFAIRELLEGDNHFSMEYKEDDQEDHGDVSDHDAPNPFEFLKKLLGVTKGS